jgi:hypothetical protein
MSIFHDYVVSRMRLASMCLPTRKPLNHGRGLARSIPSAEDGWKPVLNTMGNGWRAGFDPEVEYEFHRAGWEKPLLFKLYDKDDNFNVYGLYWREPPNAGRELARIGIEKRRLSQRELYKRTHDELRRGLGLSAIQWRD